MPSTRAFSSGLALSVCLLWTMSDAAAVLTLRTGSHNGAPPFPRTNGRQIATNSQGIWVLVHDGLADGQPTVFLSTSKDSRPEFAGDFTPAMAMAGESSQSVLAGPFAGAQAASLVIGPDDTLHLVFQSSEPQGIWYARCPAGGMNPSASLGRRENWTRAAGKAPGPERIDHGEGIEFGDLVTDARGRTSGALGMALATRGGEGGVFFDTLKIPDLNPGPGRKVLFLDMLEVSALEGLKRSFHSMRKHAANPVLRTGSPGAWDDTRAVSYGEVLIDEGKFRMWYSGTNRDSMRRGEGQTVAIPDSRRLQLRFRLTGRARLYSFTFR